ncbi:acetyl-CoA carboxylase carboxyltransferase component [Sinorhizobium fredii]|uniref:Methylmalonyl-CoA carboxyltransferase 12S subunit n=1 Tax=Sinorhizobium fredii (strain USDA 257) TaxID=1185652 RepID=I3X380_SINF2|nr:carboxyl transferase domain-containing protein [Sinorhizobium fredii]AFL50336.1 methylmalonyl-CoA carboxyltransferase 12S subunit [Sinorhizobium fredii USDA 257]
MTREISPEWKALLSELERRREIALASGGPERIAREHKYDRSTARERIAKISDPGTFLEIGTFVTTPTEDGSLLASTFVCGLTEIDGRPVAIGAEDYSVEGGGTGVHLARYKGGWGGFIEEFAIGYKVPLVMLINGVGGSVILQDQIGYPELQSANPTYPMFDLLEQVPVLAAVLGPTAGSSAARAHISHFSVMTSDNGCLFAGGPPVVKQALGLDIDKFALGGVAVHTRASGLIDNHADNEDAALAQIKQVLAYLPDNVSTRPAVQHEWRANDQEDLLTIVSPTLRRAYDVHALVRCLVDQDTFFEIAPDYGRSLRTGFARIEGHTIGILASDARFVAGSLDVQSSLKQAKFVELCDRFHIPIAYLVDVPGFLVGPKAEEAGVLKFGAMALRAIQQAKVPVITVQVRRSYGLGGVATGSRNPMSIRLVWPSAAWGDMPLEGGVEAAFRAQLDAAPPERRAELKAQLTQRFEEQTSIWRAVENFGAEEMIDPRDTRKYLARLIKLAYRKTLET